MLGGYWGLTQFLGGKVERADLKKKSQSKREFSLEEERTVSAAAIAASAAALAAHGWYPSRRCVTETIFPPRVRALRALVSQLMLEKLTLDEYDNKPIPKLTRRD